MFNSNETERSGRITQALQRLGENQGVDTVHTGGDRLDAIVQRALATSPADRFQDAAEFRTELVSVLLDIVPLKEWPA